jgi:hypothetical protein
MIYLLTAIGLTPGGSSTVHIYTQYAEQHNNRTTKLNNRTTQSHMSYINTKSLYDNLILK